MTVLVLAQELDRTADGVVEGLIRRGVPVFRLDTSYFPQRLTVEAELSGGRWSGRLVTEHREVDLEAVRAIWVRTPATFILPEGMSIAERDYARREGKLGLGGVLLSLPALWVNRPDLAATAAYKPLQLTTANRCRLATARTLISNSPPALRRFVHTAGTNGTVIKPLGTTLIYEDNTFKMGWTHRLAPDDLADFAGFDVTCHQVQDWADKAHECRVVVVGDRMFAVAIHAGSPESYVDWRADHNSLSYEVIELPSQVQHGIRAFMAELGLIYGAFDFVVGPDGGFTFLECNPGGQFGFLEGISGLPITETLVALLATGGNR